MSRLYLSKDQILKIHHSRIERYGGSHGVLNEGYIESALGRLQSGYYEDLIEEAAALWESLAGNHAFQDGNKRVAFAAMDVFLRVNGKQITASPKDAVAFIYERYARKEMDFDHLKAWLQDNTRDRERGSQKQAANDLLERYPRDQRRQNSDEDDNGHDQ